MKSLILLVLTFAVLCQRPSPSERKFKSSVIEDTIKDISSRMKDKELAQIFSNTFPNTLDTTVFYNEKEQDTFIITGDIPAMWLRDSTNQVWPYLPFLTRDKELQNMIKGLIHRQANSVLIDPYANAFNKDAFSQFSGHSDDQTFKLGFLKTKTNAMTPLIWERKYELDSLCAVMRLSSGYYENTRDVSPFNETWVSSIKLILSTIKEQQKGTEEDKRPEYTFSRTTQHQTETLHHSIHCSPSKRIGLSKSPFRPSDDACKLPFLIPANAMAVTTLKSIIPILDKLNQRELITQVRSLSDEIQTAIERHAIVNGMYAYEIDGFGSSILMDDANVPSLLSLPYLGYISKSNPVYQKTRKYVLSKENPWFFEGKAGKGIGGPHNGLNWIWPMSIIMQAFTSDNDEEIIQCLKMLKDSSIHTGFIHESFNKDNVQVFTRPWFSWANTLFGELILQLAKERPHLIF